MTKIKIVRDPPPPRRNFQDSPMITVSNCCSSGSVVYLDACVVLLFEWKFDRNIRVGPDKHFISWTDQESKYRRGEGPDKAGFVLFLCLFIFVIKRI